MLGLLETPKTAKKIAEDQSGAFRRFYDSFLGDPQLSAQQGLDTEAIAALSGVEREAAEALLLRLGDRRAVIGLGLLRSWSAVRPLRRRLVNAKLKQRCGEVVETAVALFRIEGNSDYALDVVEMLKLSRHWADRVSAVLALREFPLTLVEDALWEAVSDRDYLVRYHACNALLRSFGKSPDPEIFPLILGPRDSAATPDENDLERYEEAKRRLRAIIAR